jgi:hypothetical protein
MIGTNLVAALDRERAARDERSLDVDDEQDVVVARLDLSRLRVGHGQLTACAGDHDAGRAQQKLSAIECVILLSAVRV